MGTGGGLAVSVRCEPRTTRDIDVAVSVLTDSQAESTSARLLARGYSFAATPLEHLAVDQIATTRLLAPPLQADRLVVDLLFASSGIEPEIVQAATLEDVLDGVVLPVACVGHLLAMKVLASRPQDLADASALASVASEKDLAITRSAIDLIRRRGFDRGYDLDERLRRLVASKDQS